jgi:glycosyltransferase involved in cell wall biosynthesis
MSVLLIEHHITFRPASRRAKPSGSYGKSLPGPACCTLIVVTRDRHHLLRRCLLGGLRDVAAAGYEVVLVDQSREWETARLTDGIPGLRYLRSGPGLSVGRNVGVAATSSPFVAFTDDDVTIGPGWLESLAAALDEVSDAGAVCGRALTPGGKLLQGGSQGIYRWPADPFRLGSGYNMAFRRCALDDVGPFDPELGAGGRFVSSEDTDMFYRLLRGGWAVVCRDDIAVVHDDWRSHRLEFALQFRYGVGTGAQTAKHLRAGDSVGGRFGLARAGRQARQVGSSLAEGHPRVAAKEAFFLAGMTMGFMRRLGSRTRT